MGAKVTTSDGHAPVVVDGGAPLAATAHSLPVASAQVLGAIALAAVTADGTTTGGYVRLQGPRLWIEIATQNGVVLSGTHYHSIERDIKSDYGA